MSETTERFEKGDRVELTEEGVRVGLARRMGRRVGEVPRAGVVVGYGRDGSLRVVRDGQTTVNNYYAAYWRRAAPPPPTPAEGPPGGPVTSGLT